MNTIPLSGNTSKADPAYSPRLGHTIVKLVMLVAGLILVVSGVTFVKVYSVLSPKLYVSLSLYSALGSLATILFSAWLLWDKKLTTERGNFLKLYAGLMVPACLFVLGMTKYIDENPNAFGGAHSSFSSRLIVVLVPVSILTLIPASILSISEEYKGCFSGLKCLKPWKVDQIITAYAPNSATARSAYRV